MALSAAGHEVLIVSSDKDFAQIVGERITIMIPPPSSNPKLGWRRMNAAGVAEKFGVSPAQIADYLALVGDTSDNIPGVGGVGPKTASRWLAQYGSLEQILARACEIEPERLREAVATGAERLRLNLKLTTLNTALPVVPISKPSPNLGELSRILEEMEMKGALAEARERYSGQGELF